MSWNIENRAILITPNTKKKNIKIGKFHYLLQLGIRAWPALGAGPFLVTASEMSLMQNGATVTLTIHKNYTSRQYGEILEEDTAVLVCLLLGLGKEKRKKKKPKLNSFVVYLLFLQSALQPSWVLAWSTTVEYSQQEGFYRIPPAAEDGTMGEKLPRILPKVATFTSLLGSFTCRKFTWDRRWGLFRPKKPTASAGFEPANSGTRGQHAYL